MLTRLSGFYLSGWREEGLWKKWSIEMVAEAPIPCQWGGPTTQEDEEVKEEGVEDANRRAAGAEPED